MVDLSEVEIYKMSLWIKCSFYFRCILLWVHHFSQEPLCSRWSDSACGSHATQIEAIVLVKKLNEAVVFVKIKPSEAVVLVKIKPSEAVVLAKNKPSEVVVFAKNKPSEVVVLAKNKTKA